MARTHRRADVTCGNKEKTQSRVSIKNPLFAPGVSHLLFIYLFIHGTEDKWTQLVALKGLLRKTKEQANNTTAEFQLIINQQRKLAERLQKPRADYSVNHT